MIVVWSERNAVKRGREQPTLIDNTLSILTAKMAVYL